MQQLREGDRIRLLSWRVEHVAPARGPGKSVLFAGSSTGMFIWPGELVNGRDLRILFAAGAEKSSSIWEASDGSTHIMRWRTYGH